LIPEEIEESSYWKIPVVLDPMIDRQIVLSRMLEAGIAVDLMYQPAVHLQPIFTKLYGTSPGLLPVTERVLSRHLCLPCHPKMSDDDVKFVGQTLLKVIDEVSMGSK
jgi:dTDP-4-amino-4,6-dideoxygalactose transaminase